MTRSAREGNLVILRHVCARLGPLLDEVALVGGCATVLLVTDEAAPDVRPTRDVDVIVDACTRTEYHRLEQRLRDLGFRQPPQTRGQAAPICRWEIENVLVDVMPTDRSILGFGSRWADEALSTAHKVTLDEDLEVRVVTAPYFLAMKIEAFQSRGEEDFYQSPDMEDIISVVDGRPEIVEEVGRCDEKCAST